MHNHKIAEKIVIHRRANLSLALLLAVSSLVALATFSAGAYAQTTNGTTFQSLYSFGNSGSYPQAALTLGADGNFYGATDSSGGGSGNGTVFKITPAGALTILHEFSGTGDGANPDGALTLGTDGNFYGTTAGGGTWDDGTVFKITPSGALTTLYSFSPRTGQYYSNSDGAYPQCGLTLGADGNFYGTAVNGGTSDNGTVFKITPSGTFTVLHLFAGVQGDGSDPINSLTLGRDGNLYGVTLDGGAADNGVVFQITPSGTYTTIYAFAATDSNSANASGAEPEAALALGNDGNLYGTTTFGGTSGLGTVFKITTGGALTTLHSFSDSSGDGELPMAGLTPSSDGSLYGATEDTLYEVTPAGVLTTLYSFSQTTGNNEVNSDGSRPNTLTIGNDGNLYGTAIEGGLQGEGTVFKLSLSGNSNPLPPASQTRFDFNQDGHADLIWYNTVSGGVSVWDMNDQAVLSYGATFTSLAPSSGWVPVAAPDANGDGSPDLLWWNSSTGELSVWTLSGTTVISYGTDFGQISDTHWKPVAVADNNGSSWTLVFQNTSTGDISRWLMSGTTVTQYGGTIFSLGPNSPYQIVGAPDLDGDGKSDLLFWNDQTGGVSWWGCDLANQQVLSYNGDFAQVSDTSWHLMGSEDTDGDGHPDLIWWNATSGIESRWLLDGTTVTQYGGTSTQVADTTWQPTAIR